MSLAMFLKTECAAYGYTHLFTTFWGSYVPNALLEPILGSKILFR